MAEFDDDKMGEDYLESLLDSVYDGEEAVKEDSDSGNDEEDIEKLLNMLDTEGMGDGIDSSEVDKVAEEFNNRSESVDMDDLENESDTKKTKEKKKLFGKKSQAKEENDIQPEDIQPDDNDKIIKSVEETLGDSFDLSDLENFEEEFGSLDDLEDRSANVKDGKSEEEIEAEKRAERKAEKKAEKERKKKEKAEKKAEKKKIKEDKKAAAKAKKAEKKKEKQEKKASVPVEKVKIPPSVAILGVTLVIALTVIALFGGEFIWYKNHVDEATSLLLDRKYTEAYESISGLKINKNDEGLQKQLKTLMYIEREYDAYNNCKAIGMEREALNALIKGIEKYDVYKKKAEEYGVSEQADEIYNNILTILKDEYNLTEEEARNIESISNKQEYSKKIEELAGVNTVSIK